MSLNDLVKSYRKSLSNNFTVTSLKTMIVIWALFIIILTVFFVDNEWLLAGILLYEVLP